MHKPPAMTSLREHLATMSETDFAMISVYDLDYSPLGRLLHAAMIEMTEDEEPPYNEHIGLFAYSLAHDAETEAEQQHLISFCQSLLSALIEFDLNENGVKKSDEQIAA